MRRQIGFGVGTMAVIGALLLILWDSLLSRLPAPNREFSLEQQIPPETILVPMLPDPVLPKEYHREDVPFTVQAPFAEWYDPIFQDACEEASITMAEAWVKGTALTRATAKERITKLASYQKKQYGHSVDTGIDDTARLLREVLGIDSSRVVRGITIEDIEEAVSQDRIVIVPTDGRKLGNPNFKVPGPPRHMLVIIGYDRETHEFIVNDPGTRRGEGYRYPETVLYDAILDYPTGRHAVATSIDKVMLMVWRELAEALQN